MNPPDEVELDDLSVTPTPVLQHQRNVLLTMLAHRVLSKIVISHLDRNIARIEGELLYRLDA